jgi:hypothetical protein
MLVHLVCFKYKANVDADARREHRSRLKALSGLEGIIQLTVGEDVVRSARSYDTGLLITFVNRGALDAYQKDPKHVPVQQLGIALSEHIVAVDFFA